MENLENRVKATKKLLNEVNKYMPFDELNEVYPNLYLGDRSAAMNKKFLESIGVNNVLNAAHGKSATQINTSQEFYNSVGIRFLGFNLTDDESVDIAKHFEEATMFIHDSIDNEQKPGKVLVHCYQGISRSATLILAYLMIYRDMGLEDAIRQVAAHRFVFPNDGFIAHLLLLQDRLQK